MAITVAMRTQVSQLYVSLFGRAPDGEGLGFWVTKLDKGTSLSTIAQEMFAVDAARAYYPAFATNGEIIATFYKNVLGRSEAEGEAFWTNKMNTATNKGDVFLELINVIVNYAGTDAAGLKSKALFNNKVAVAQHYGETMGSAEGATAVLAGVTDDVATVAAAKLLAGKTINLSVTQDTPTGTAGADTFVAKVAQNQNGEQTNQLATGDDIDGGAGNDALVATVIAASPLNAGPQMSITPETVDVEHVAFIALRTIESGSSTQTVEINAKFMDGLDKISSVHSDASLLVTNVNTLTDSGDYATKRLTESLTVRMDHSGNDQTVPESNMTVLIDNDYLLAADPTQSVTLSVALTPQIELAKYDATAPLKNNPYDTLTIKVDGVSKVINIATGTPATPVQTTYAALETALKAGLVAAGLSDVVVTRNVGAFVYSARDGAARSADTFTLSKAGSVLTTQGAGSWAALAGLPDDNSFGAIVRPGDASSTAPQITVQVELEKVGRGSDGGGLIIGAMATDGGNDLDFSSTPTQAEGVEKFNVKVSGDASQFSSLSYLHSTNNTLETVVVTSATGSKADLIIGNQNTENQFAGAEITDAMKDVREFDSTAFANDVTLNASLTDEVTDKYMDLIDTAAPAADNVTFKYNFGVGNDELNLVLDKINFDFVGTTTREDFVLSIDGGAGNDEITVDLTGTGNEDGSAAWYNNSKINANLSIAGGAGDDTISTLGGGDYKINAGAGNDTVYSDNSGDDAVWVFNTTDQTSGASPAREQNDLISSTNSSYNLYKATAAVTFRGLVSAKIVIESSTTTYKSTDLQINQAIKKAINSDAVLSKLIVATDGPANTLVVTSLTDGVRTVTDLSVAIVVPASADLTTAEIGAVAAVYGTAVTYAGVTGGMATVFADYDAQFENIGVAEQEGADSDAAADSTHTLSTGNDVLVLSTNHDDAGVSSTILASNETSVYTAVDFGNDVIVNFQATGTGIDKLDFRTFLGTTATTNVQDATALAVASTNSLVVVGLVDTTGTALTGVRNDSAAEVKALYTDDTTANKGLYITVSAGNVGTVYAVADGTAASDLTVTLLGTIDLADTDWTTLTAANFA